MRQGEQHSFFRRHIHKKLGDGIPHNGICDCDILGTPYAASVLALQETGGLPFTMLFGKLVAMEKVKGWMLLGTEVLAKKSGTS